jgi:hypothetical protein
MFIRLKLFFVAFAALMLPCNIPNLVESKAIAQVSKQNGIDASQQAIIAGYQTMREGLWNRNINQTFSVYSPQYTAVSPDGKVKSLKQIRDEWQQIMPKLYQLIFSYKFQQIQINGATATVLGIENQYINFPDPQKNSPYAYSSVSGVTQFRDTWKYTSNGWKLTNRRILQETASSSKPHGHREVYPVYPSTIPIPPPIIWGY